MAKKNAYFEPVDLKVNFPELEKKLLDGWYKKGVVKKYLSKNKNSPPAGRAGNKNFSFLDGPITANNPMGVHHAWGRTYKDVWQRFKNMQGFKQRFQNGFDCQGLWVEVEVEKELGFKNKKDIEDYGVAKFVEKCRERVRKYSEIQTEQSKLLGYFMDWDNSYYTLSNDNNYMIWRFLKKCFENGWIYKGNDVVPWCPRCETAISEHEILTENYKEVTHDSIFLTFPVVGREDEYLLVWTTTPWTVPANIAVAVDEKLEYALVEMKKNRYWLAKDAVVRVLNGEKYKILKTTPGGKLVGLRYKGPFDDLSIIAEMGSKNDKFHTIVATDNLIMPITSDEGTGLVHTSTGTGAEDHKFGKKIGLPVIPAINDVAEYLPGYDLLTGKNAKKHPEIIIDYLKSLDEGKFIFKVMPYTHRYPACWRCKTELVWKVTDEWYIAMDKPAKIQKSNFKIQNLEKWNDEEEKISESDTRTLRERMKDVTQKIKWLPSFGLEREMDWLGNMHDWLVSKKNRYWGLALPIWECKNCGNFEVIGSYEELKEKATSGWKEFEGKTPHKPQIDAVKIKCGRCGHTMDRIEPVGNPWLDAGIVAFSTISENNKACGLKDSKTKPLYLTNRNEWQKWYPADFITESFPGQFKNWFYALIAMSTVMENSPSFKTVLGFGTLTDEQGRPMHKSSGNMIEFKEGADKIGVDVMRWMYVRQNPADNLLFGYKTADDVRRRFHLKLWNIYNFFVTYANLDGWKPLKNSKNQKLQNSNVLDNWIIARLNQTIKLVTDGLEKYDAFTASAEIEKFVDDLSAWYVRRSRDRVGPASSIESDKNSFFSTLYFVLMTTSKILMPFTPFLADAIFNNLTKGETVNLADWPIAKALSDKDMKILGEMENARQVVEIALSERKDKAISVKQPLGSFSTKFEKLSKDIEGLVKDEINVKMVNWKANANKLDTKITPILAEEARVRSLVRMIQEERKNLGLNLTQKVNVTLEEIPEEKGLLDWLIKKTQIAKIEKGKFKVAKASK